MLLGAGLIAMFVAHKMDYDWFGRLSFIAMGASIPLLLLTYFVGSSVNEASRWLQIPGVGVGFQPSDLAKLALIAYTASMLSKHEKTIDTPASINALYLSVGVATVIVSGLIAMTNFSTAALLIMTIVLMLFIGRMPMKALMKALAVLILFGLLGLSMGTRGRTAISRLANYASAVTSGKSTKAKVDSDDFQITQSYYAIANGNSPFGRGPGGSLQKDFLPESYSDFVFAIIVEEYGMLGYLTVIGAYIILLYRGLTTIDNSTNPFGALLAAGISFSIAIQAFVNMGVAVGLLPVTGQPLPFVSMGGTSLIFTGLSFGILQSIARKNQARQKKHEGNTQPISFGLSR